MAKRSKKKNPSAPSNQQRQIMRHNQELDLEKSKLDKKLNITIAVVIAVAMISLLLLPLLNMNFSGSLDDILGEDSALQINADDLGIELNMTAFDFLFAMTKGYEDSARYIANANASGIGAEIIYNAFMLKATQEDVDMLDNAYIVAFILCILLFIVAVALLVITIIKRSKKQDGLSFMIASIAFSAVAVIQWIFFVAVGIASAGRGQITPHIGSWLIFAAAVTLCVVYGLYRSKVKKLNAQKKSVEDTQNVRANKEEK